MMQVINLTQEPSTSEQDAFDIPGADGEEVRRLLTFCKMPSPAELQYRANQLAALAYAHAYWNAVDAFKKQSNNNVEELIKAIHSTKVMVDGPIYLMPLLVTAVRRQGLVPVYSFKSKRLPTRLADGFDGTVSFSETPKHIDWIEA